MDELNPINVSGAETPEPKKMNILLRLLSIFISPIKLMINIRDYPVLLQPLVLIAVIGIPGAFLSKGLAEIQLREQMEYMIANYGSSVLSTSGQQASAGLMSNTPVIYAISFGSVFLISLVNSGLYYLFGKLLKAKATFRQYFSVLLHSDVIACVGSVIAGYFSVMIGKNLDVTSLAALIMPGENFYNPVYAALLSVSLFSIWRLILLILGIKEINGFGYKRAAILPILFFVIQVAIAAGSSILSVMSFEMMQSLNSLTGN